MFRKLSYNNKETFVFIVKMSNMDYFSCRYSFYYTKNKPNKSCGNHFDQEFCIPCAIFKSQLSSMGISDITLLMQRTY